MNNANLRLKSVMVAKGKTQQTLCRDLKMNIATFNRKVNGIREFSESEMKAISNYLEVSPLDIFFNDEVDKRTTKTA
jgi:transcriptional regulator with XRE-family HTH domain